MTRRLPSLAALRMFEAAARHESFKRAADELAVSPTAVSHQIRALEAQIGLVLFERRTRKVVLTEAGSRLFPVLREGFDAFADVLQRLQRHRPRALVTISATVAFTARWLVPRAAEFHRSHPRIDLQFHASDDTVEIGASGADVAVRYGHGLYEDFDVLPLFADRFAPLFNPLLGVRDLADLLRRPRIVFQWRRNDPDNPTWERWFEAAGLADVDEPPVLRFSDESHAIQAAVAGQGVALASLALVRDDLEAGRLVRPFAPEIAGFQYHVLTRPRQTDPSIAAVVRWLQTEGASGGSRHHAQ